MAARALGENWPMSGKAAALTMLCRSNVLRLIPCSNNMRVSSGFLCDWLGRQSRAAVHRFPMSDARSCGNSVGVTAADKGPARWPDDRSVGGPVKQSAGVDKYLTTTGIASQRR